MTADVELDRLPTVDDIIAACSGDSDPLARSHLLNRQVGALIAELQERREQLAQVQKWMEWYYEGVADMNADQLLEQIRAMAALEPTDPKERLVVDRLREALARRDAKKLARRDAKKSVDNS